MIKITLKAPQDVSPLISSALKSGLDSATSQVVTLQKNAVPVRTGTLKRSIYGDFTQLDNFKAAVVQNTGGNSAVAKAPYGPITNNGYDGIITPKHAKALRIKTKDGVIYRKSVRGQKGTHWWEKIKDHTEDIQAAFVKGFNRVIGKG